MIPFLLFWVVLWLALVVWAYWSNIWGWDGLFFYHKSERQGHMLCHLGWREYYRVFGFSWVVDTDD